MHSPFTDQQIADQLTRDGGFWYGDNGDNIINYSFSSSLGYWDGQNGGISTEFALNNVQQTWIETALDSLTDLFDLTFVEVGQPANTSNSPPFDIMQFVNIPGNGTYSQSWSYSNGGIAFNNVVFDSNWNSNQAVNLDYGSYGYMTMLHEILHSLGLEHPGEYNAGGGQVITYQNNAEFEQDTHRYSIMSYFQSYEDGSGAIFYDTETNSFEYPRTAMVYDILAMTQGAFNGGFGGYGANSTTRSTDTTYGYNATAGIDQAFNFAAHGAPVLTLYDTGGTDTLDLSGDTVANEAYANYNGAGEFVNYGTRARTDTLIDLREGGYSSTHGMTFNIGIAFGTIIENAIGTQFNDTIHANSANNIIYSSAGDDLIYLYDGNDRAYGGDNNDTIHGGAGNDALFGDGGMDSLFGGEGNDGLVGGTDADNLNGGNGIDTAYYWTSTAAINVDLTRATQTGGDAQGDTLTGIENISGTNYNDFLRGDGNSNKLFGLNGNDRFYGLNGNDSIYGDGGNDALFGDGGMDSLFGGEGNDGFVGGTDADSLNGGNGIDTAYYWTSSAGIDVDLTRAAQIGGDAQGDTLTGIENVSGTNHTDILSGDAGNNSLYGLNGADTLNGGLGNDKLIGGSGADIFEFDSTIWGNDQILDFADGVDLLDFTGAGLTYGDLTIIDTVQGLDIQYIDSGTTSLVSILNLDPNALSETDFV